MLISKSFAAFAMVLAVGVLARGDDAKPKDAKALEGTWLPATAELGGEPFPDEIRKAIKLVVEDGKYTVTIGKESDRGTVTIDPSKTPKAMDLVGTEGPNKGKTIPCIYERTGDTLRICYDLTGKARPKEFKTTPGTQLFLVDYKKP